MKLMFLLLPLVGCASASMMSERSMIDADMNFRGERAGDAVVLVSDDKDVSRAQPAEPAQEKDPRLLIYTASFGILVPDSNAAIERLLTSTASAGGYLATRHDRRITLRLPAAEFHNFVRALEDYGVITARNVQASDVTAQYRDLALRIENADRARIRLLALLDKAAETKDLLEIERELRRLTEEIESMKGQLRQMADQIAFSTITVEFLEDAPEPRAVHMRRESRFPWINKIGVENALDRF